MLIKYNQFMNISVCIFKPSLDGESQISGSKLPTLVPMQIVFCWVTDRRAWLRRQILLFVAATASHAQRIMGIQNDVGGSNDATGAHHSERAGAALAFEGLNDIVVLAFRKQGSLSHT